MLLGSGNGRGDAMAQLSGLREGAGADSRRQLRQLGGVDNAVPSLFSHQSISGSCLAYSMCGNRSIRQSKIRTLLAGMNVCWLCAALWQAMVSQYLAW
jgi:hypothetical protein